jgi:hypothetical protein
MQLPYQLQPLFRLLSFSAQLAHLPVCCQPSPGRPELPIAMHTRSLWLLALVALAGSALAQVDKATVVRHQ